MDLQLSAEQEAFVATTRRFLDAECPVPATRALEHDPDGFDRAVWRRGAELGWTSLLVPEADGGGSLSDHGLFDLVLVAEEMGRLVAPGPLGPVSVVADAVGRLGTSQQRAEVLPGLLDGSQVAAWCGPHHVDGRRRSDGRLELHGTCAPVEAAVSATHLLVGVQTLDGPAQVLLRSDRPGVTITPLEGLDLVRRHARVELDGAVVDDGAILDDRGDVRASVARQRDLAATIQCAETVGAIDRVFAMTLEYLGDRWSFGRPLASYQALKHRMADEKMWLEASHAIATAATRAMALSTPDAAEVVSAAKAWIGPHATELVQDCIQLHGGIGVTWEHDLHLYLRRVTVNRASHGTPEEHAERIAGRLLETAP